jgi:NAD+ dependent glucose-6-phosphate dehydrogenase
MKKGKLLITGIKGNIGSVLAKNLNDKYDIYGIDITPSKDRKYFQVDISDYDKLNDVFKKIGKIDATIHLAADSSTNAKWMSVLKNNIEGTRNIYECARIHKVPKIIFASSNQTMSA